MNDAVLTAIARTLITPCTCGDLPRYTNAVCNYIRLGTCERCTAERTLRMWLASLDHAHDDPSDVR